MGDHRESVAPHFEVLGPLRAWRGQSALDAGPAQQRVVLAVLLLHLNKPVGREQLIDAVWGPSPPACVVNLVQRHVSGLRRALEPARPARTPSRLLAWTDAGYQLTAPAEHLDLETFEQSTGRARAARAAGDMPGAAAALHAALRLWRGSFCYGLTSPLLNVERDRLEELRIRAVEDRIEADLALGGHLDLIAELRQLVAQHPLRERLRGLLMLALHRSGRQAEASAAFHDTRRHLRDEFGMEPAAHVQRLHEQILTDDPALAIPNPTHDVPVGAALGTADHRLPAPAQLPHRVPDFIGRDTELDRLHSLLSGAEHGTGRAGMISVITGTGGVGKTALAVHWAQQVRDRFPDGQLYANLRGFDPAGAAMDPAEAVRGFLDALGVPPQRIPVTAAAQTALYRSLLADRRMLIVLDNAVDADQVRPLLPGSPACLVVVTSRHQLTSLVASEGAYPLMVDLFTPREARELLARRLGPGRVAAEPDATNEIVLQCAGLPLALAIVAARAATHPQFPLAAFARELTSAGGRLDALAAGGDAAIDVRAVFSCSYHTLSAEAARLFRLLGLHPGPDIATAAAASLADRTIEQVRPVLAGLARVHLISEHAPDRYAFHDLLRAYAAELAHTHYHADQRRNLIRRVLDHYLHSAYAAALLLDPHREPISLTPLQPGVSPEQFADHDGAMTWLTTEHGVLLAAVEQAAAMNCDMHTWQLAWTLTDFLDRRGHWHDRATTQRAALAAALRLGDHAAQAHAHRYLGYVYSRLGREDNAHTHLQHALDLYDQLCDPLGKARTHQSLAEVCGLRRRHDEALHHARHALDLYRSSGHRAGEALALNSIGWHHAQLGDHEQALTLCEQSLALHEEIGAHRSKAQAHAWDSLGYAHHHLGHGDRAIACFQQALDLYRSRADRYHEAATLTRLGDTHHAGDHEEPAHAAWQAALTIFDQLGHPDADHLRVKLRRLGPRPLSIANLTGAGI
jgi:DNA-binding SARP family transcriptional activator/tetratricopeptide (TPR) repeat protein